MNTKRITEPFQVIHDAAGDGMALIAPALAPALSAIAVYAGLVDDFGRIAAAIGAFVVEGLGFAAVRLMLRVWNERDPSLPMRAATLAMSATYMVATYAILLSTHVVGYALSFPLLTMTGALAYGINTELGRQDAAPLDEAKRKIDLQAYRKQAMAKVFTPVYREQSAARTPEAQTPTNAATVNDLRVYREQHPGSGVRETARALGMSPAWVSKWNKSIDQEGN